MSMVIFILQQVLLFAVPLIVAGIGGMFCERGGIVNISIEGTMIVGAVCGCLFLHSSQGSMSGQGIFLLALLISGVAGLLFSALHGLASIHFNANQAISGIALNIAAPALAIFVARLLIGRQQVSFSNTYRIAAVPVLSEIPIIGDIFFQQVYLSYYIAIAVAIAGAVIIKKTRFGLRLRACGEFPQAADSVGVNVYRTRYAGVLICGFLAGMSGLMLVVPTATTRPPLSRAALMRAAASAVTSKYSECISCSSTFSVLTGRNVPSPTCSSTGTTSTPFSRMRSSSSGVKCRPAVGAAAEPSCFA